MKLSENPVSKDVQALYSSTNTTAATQTSASAENSTQSTTATPEANSTAASPESTTNAFAESKNVTSDIASAINNL